jgi:hypothetical protein
MQTLQEARSSHLTVCHRQHRQQALPLTKLPSLAFFIARPEFQHEPPWLTLLTFGAFRLLS